MSSRRTILIFVVIFGVGIHAIFLYLLHNLAIAPYHSYENTVALDNEWVEKQERTKALSEIFDHLNEEEPTVKQALYELQTEYAPAIELSFPSLHPEPHSELFVFEHDTAALPLVSTPSDLFGWEGTTLIEPVPLVTTIETPPLMELAISDEAYEDFGCIASSDHFDIHVEYAPKRFRPGYVFKLTFNPRSEILFKRIQQNYFFLLDRSNSIPRARYFLNKSAVALALEHLQAGDTFNILLFDDKVVRFAEKSVTASAENITEAQEFLKRQPHGGYFAATELYASLGKIIPKDVSEKEVNTAILLSDGDTYLSLEKQRKTIGGWTQDNEGKVALYTIASGTGNNLPLLDLLSAFNKGSLVYTQDHKLLNERLSHLMHHIRNPIGKRMAATAITADRQMNILLQPKQSRLPDLYQHKPFVIYGSTNRLSDFVLFLQGKYYDHSFDIKKTISFKGAKMGDPAIERQWTQIVAQDIYERYFEDGNTAHLDAAKKLLTPLNIPVPLLTKK